MIDRLAGSSIELNDGFARNWFEVLQHDLDQAPGSDRHLFDQEAILSTETFKRIGVQASMDHTIILDVDLLYEPAVLPENRTMRLPRSL